MAQVTFSMICRICNEPFVLTNQNSEYVDFVIEQGMFYKKHHQCELNQKQMPHDVPFISKPKKAPRKKRK